MDQDPDGTRLQLDRARDEALVHRWRAGDERAFGELYDAWFDRVHDLAARVVRDPARAADVAQDTFLAAWKRIDTLDDPAAFGGWLLRICRNRALNVVEKEARATAVDDQAFRAIEAEGSPVSAPDGFRVGQQLAGFDDPAQAVGDRELVDLLWEAADALGERDRTVLDLQLRHGLSPAEIGEVVGVNRNAANQLVHRVKKRLEGAVTARLLWRGRAPSCAALLAELEAAGIARFDQQAISVANRHAETCAECGDRQRVGLQPAALFGAVPIMVAPFALKQQAAAALMAEGVPLSGSTVAPTAVPAASPGGGSGAGLTAAGVGPVTDEAIASAAGAGGAGTADIGAAAGEPPEGSMSRSWRRALLVAAILALLALGGATLLVLPDDDPDPTEVATASTLPDGLADDTHAPTSTTVPSTIAVRSGTAALPIGHPTTSTTGATTTTVVGVPASGPTTTADPAPTTTAGPTTTTIPATATISVAPSSAPPVFPLSLQPVLTWSTTGGTSVHVSGPNVDETASSGSVSFCPIPPGSVCGPLLGTYTYTVEVRGSGGALLASDTATFTAM